MPASGVLMMNIPQDPVPQKRKVHSAGVKIHLIIQASELSMYMIRVWKGKVTSQDMKKMEQQICL